MAIKNSHDQYRDAKQTDKTVIDLVIRFFSFEVQNLFVSLLNEANTFVQEAHDRERGREIIARKDFLMDFPNSSNVAPVSEKEAVTLKSSSMTDDAVSKEELNTEENTNPTLQPRKRKRTERYADTLLEKQVYQQYGRGKRQKSKGKAPVATQDSPEETSYRFEESSFEEDIDSVNDDLTDEKETVNEDDLTEFEKG